VVHITVVSLRNRSNWSHAPVFRIDRTTILGNPYIIGKDGTREDVIHKYRENLPKLYLNDPEIKDIIDNIRRFPVVQLACWCAPLLCHGDAIKDFILEYEKNRGYIHSGQTTKDRNSRKQTSTRTKTFTEETSIQIPPLSHNDS
jgi:hypothetical protein